MISKSYINNDVGFYKQSKCYMRSSTQYEEWILGLVTVCSCDWIIILLGAASLDFI